MSTHNIPFSIKKQRKSPYVIVHLQLWDCPKRLKYEFETCMVNEPSVFESLMVYCTCIFPLDEHRHLIIEDRLLLK